MVRWFRSVSSLIDLRLIYVAVIHCVITVITDSTIFDPSKVFNSVEYYVFKPLVFIFIFLFWQAVGLFYKGLRNKNEVCVIFLKHFLIYFGIMIGFLILVWPGVWRSDDIVVFSYARLLELEYWQHFVTAAFDIFCLMIIPLPAGIVIMQVLFISLIFAYIITNCEILFFKSKLVDLMYIPFLLPTIIDNNLFPLRSGLYAFLVLLFFFHVIFKYKNNNKVTWHNVFFWAALISIIAVWRSEAIYYVLLAPVVILLLFRKNVDNKKLALLLLIVIISTSILNNIQNRGLQKQNSNYKLSAISEPLASLLKVDLKGNNVNKHLIEIDKVVNVELLKTHGGMEALFYLGGVRPNYTPKDYNNMLKSFAYLTLNNMKPVLENRLSNFKEASGFKTIPNSTILNSSELFKLVSPYDQNPLYRDFIRIPFNQPVSVELREKVVKILELRRIDNYHLTTPLYSFFYNVFPCVIFLLFMMIYYLFKREWGMASLLILILGAFPLIFFTAPAPYFMYYIPIFLFSYAYAMFFIISQLMKKRESNSFS
ncbi:hypothetical protein [Paenibacillus sp. GP183]|uniref:hypothetical protein n=1 Tax=Paenibacillus sp. GP183 TaxID=1882751 RepID=UPI000894EB09|nr:hypothetical protein [Paenibacillus sp. GP183]SEC12477.1 hypothetical protein SAMN05443246_3074 [Paenibacillus sp. GP183]